METPDEALHLSARYIEMVNEHFKPAVDWAEAAELVDFEPRRPEYTAGCALASLAVHVMDHDKRWLPKGARSLEAHFGRFVIAQQRVSSQEKAKRWALNTAYGPDPAKASVAGHEAQKHVLGPEPEVDDADGRSPAIIVWHDGNMFYLVASSELDVEILHRIASSMYDE